jgi:hypothetical protein
MMMLGYLSLSETVMRVQPTTKNRVTSLNVYSITLVTLMFESILGKLGVSVCPYVAEFFSDGPP